MGAAVEKGWKSIFDDLYNIWNALIYHGYIKKNNYFRQHGCIYACIGQNENDLATPAQPVLLIHRYSSLPQHLNQYTYLSTMKNKMQTIAQITSHLEDSPVLAVESLLTCLLLAS